LEVVYHHVTVKISGQVARTSIDQEFYNPNNQRLEGTYLFPVPKGAQLDKFVMEIGGKPVEAELLPADKARQIYEDIVRKMKDPALLEYADRDTFKVRIFPIEPTERKHITLSYTQLLKADAGLVGYTYPLNTEKFSSAPIKSVSVKIELDAKRPLKAIYSPSHTVEIKRTGTDRATIGFEAKDVKPDTDFQVFWSEQDKDVGVNLLTYRKPGEEAGFFLLLASPGAESAGDKIVPKDVAFVLDTSGSMAGKKLEQAKKALRFCVENLNDNDRFEVIRFSTEAEPLFHKLVDATRDNRQRANEFIEGLKPIGGTAIEEALLKALSLRPGHDRPYVIIFLTDGQPTIGNTKEEDILPAVKKANTGNTRVFCFGIGTDVNTHLLDKITEQTRAVSQYVLPEEDIEIKVSNFYTKIKDPVLSNPTLKVTGDISLSKLHPPTLPDLFRGDQLVLAGRFTGKGSSAVIIEGTVDGKPQKFAFDVSFPEKADEHDFIPRLWATRRIGYLLDESRLRGENKELRDEITDLARQYGIVTPYTAYLIVEDEAKRNVPLAARSMQEFDRDTSAREGAGRAWIAYNAEKAGDAAVAGARASGSMQLAPASPNSDMAFRREQIRAMGAGMGSGYAEVAQRVDQYTQQSRYVRGRNFFQNGEQWIDSEVQKQQDARRVQIKFGTDDYFAFIRKNRDAQEWFALGRNVQVAIGDTIYEVID
jgi:Ca-activated chloride channel family protein